MEPYDGQDYGRYYSNSAPRYMSSGNSNYYNYNMHPPQQYYDEGMPPPLPPNKPKKKSMLKSPLTAIKNAFIKGTKPLRRMNSMVEPERKSGKSALKRQHSLLERQMQRPYYPDEFPTYPAGFEQQYREPIYNQQQQYYNTYHQPMRYDDYGTYQNLESEDIYGNISRRHYAPATTPYENEEIYANRALIDLERRQSAAMAGRNGRGIVRRHSTTTADRAGVRRSPADYKQQINGAHPQAPNSEVMARRRFYAPTNGHDVHAMEQLEEPVYQTRREMQREMQRNHLYQSRQEMQERIQQGKREMEREFSTHSSSSQSEREEPLVERDIGGRRQEYKDSAFRTRAQLREKIYQTRRDTLDSMAEPIYVSKRDNTKRPDPIYECKEELLLHSRENETDESKKEEVAVEVEIEINEAEKTGNETDLQQSTDTTVIAAEQTMLPTNSETLTAAAILAPKAPIVKGEELDDDLAASVEDLQITAIPHPPVLHINQIIQPPLAPPPAAPMNSISQLSLSTQASIPSGVPNATSTPYTSNMSLPVAGPVNPAINHHELFPTMPRESKTSRAVFDCKGGILRDPSWHVSLHIPAGAIPEGVRQEIYFTVSDPRMGESVGGPPLDMENGLFVCCLFHTLVGCYVFFFFFF